MRLMVCAPPRKVREHPDMSYRTALGLSFVGSWDWNGLAILKRSDLRAQLTQYLLKVHAQACEAAREPTAAAEAIASSLGATVRETTTEEPEVVQHKRESQALVNSLEFMFAVVTLASSVDQSSPLHLEDRCVVAASVCWRSCQEARAGEQGPRS